MFEEQLPISLEPLEDLAMFAWRNAPQLCDPSHGCQSYHRTWSLVRVLSQTSAAPVGQKLFVNGLESLSGDPQPRILISGGADTGLLAIAISAFMKSDITPTFVFTDRCKTTVEQNRMFAEKCGVEFEQVVGDVRAMDTAPVDAILAHQFLRFFEPEGRKSVIGNWARLLKTDGILMMINSVALGGDTSPVVKDPSLYLERGARIRALAEKSFFPQGDLDELGRVASEFGHLPPAEPMTEEGLRSWLTDAGLDIELVCFDLRRISKSPANPSKNFTPHSNRPRSFIQARKIQS